MIQQTIRHFDFSNEKSERRLVNEKIEREI